MVEPPRSNWIILPTYDKRAVQSNLLIQSNFLVVSRQHHVDSEGDLRSAYELAESTEQLLVRDEVGKAPTEVDIAGEGFPALGVFEISFSRATHDAEASRVLEARVGLLELHEVDRDDAVLPVAIRVQLQAPLRLRLSDHQLKRRRADVLVSLGFVNEIPIEVPHRPCDDRSRHNLRVIGDNVVSAVGSR